MRKDHIRDYATDAFVYYATLGKTAEQLKRDIGDKLIDERRERLLGSGGFGSPTEWAVMQKEYIIDILRAEIADIEAVEKTLQRLQREGAYIAVEAVDKVYFGNTNTIYKRGEISARVQKASLEIPCSESAIYKGLRKARKIFSEERGLRQVYSSRP